MPMAVIKELAMAGINSDLIAADIAPNFITDCKNIRAVSGGLSPFGGYSSMFELPVGKKPQDLLYVDSGSEKFWIIICSNAIYKLDSNLIEVTPVGMSEVGVPTMWSTTDLSGIPIINHPTVGPMYMMDSDSTFKPLPFKSGQTWHQANQICNVMVSHKQFLFAFGISDNGKYIPDGVRWSAPADIGGLPPTWDHLDTTRAAGYTTLGGTGGEIIGALPMRDALVVYRSHGISVIDYVGGRYIWRIRHLNSNIGLISQDAVVDVRGTHYFMAEGDVYKTDGNSIQSIATKRIKKRLGMINKSAYKTAYAVHSPSNSEVMFCMPITGSTYPNIAFVYNYLYDSWFIRDMPIHVKSTYGITIKKTTDWDTLATDWDGWNNSWDDDSTTPFDNSIVGIMPPATDADKGKIIVLDSIIGFNNEPFDSIIERTDFILGSLDQATTIQRIYPHIQSANKVKIQVGSQQSPGGSVTWKPPIEFDPNTQRKVDMRTTGILHAYRIIAENVKTDFVVSGIDIVFVPAGGR